VGSKYLNPGPASSIVLTTGIVADRPIPNWSIVASYDEEFGDRLEADSSESCVHPHSLQGF
jgi:hypothetical protein